VIQQVAHADLRRGDFVGDAEPWEVALDWRVKLQFASLDQLHDRHAGHRFPERGELERGLRRDRTPIRASAAEALEMDDLIALDDRERQARNAQVAHLSVDVGVDRGEIGRTVPGGHCSSRGAGEQHSQGEQGQHQYWQKAFQPADVHLRVPFNESGFRAVGELSDHGASPVSGV
jgi:hypothetical protein